MTDPRPDLARLTDAALFERYIRYLAVLELANSREERRLIWNNDIGPLHSEVCRRYPAHSLSESDPAEVA